jgi:hypothetical protein
MPEYTSKQRFYVLSIAVKLFAVPVVGSTVMFSQTCNLSSDTNGGPQ